MIRSAVTVALAASMSIQTPPGVPRAPAAMEGVWEAESMEANGRAMPGQVVKGVVFAFKGDQLNITGLSAESAEQPHTIRIDEKASPHQLDFTSVKIPARTTYAIYEITPDGKLRVMFARGGDAASRPASFAATTPPGSRNGLLLIVLKKR